MKGIHLVVALGAVAVTYGYPMDQEQGKSPNLVTGVFIPSDAFNNLQVRANANSPNNQQSIQGGQPMQNPQPNYQPIGIQPYQQSNQPLVMTNRQPQPNIQQPNFNNQVMMTGQPTLVSNQQAVMTNQPINNQPIGSNIQPVISNQQPMVYAQQPLTGEIDPNQPMMVMTNQPSEKTMSNQPNIVLVQQPSSNQPIYVQQPNQLGNQEYVIQNGQPNQPTQVIIATNPSNGNQIQGTLVAPPNRNQPGSTVYTLIPLNRQN